MRKASLKPGPDAFPLRFEPIFEFRVTEVDPQPRAAAPLPVCKTLNQSSHLQCTLSDKLHVLWLFVSSGFPAAPGSVAALAGAVSTAQA